MTIKSTIAAAALAVGVAACGDNTVHVGRQLPSQPATKYTQIERLSRPAVKEVFERFVDHQVSNAAEPYNDPTLAAAIPAVAQQALGRSPQTATQLASILYPDEYIVDLASTDNASYLGVETGGFTGGKFGGRDINDDVIDISLSAVFGNAISALGLAPDDKAENTCLTNQHVSPTSPSNKTVQSKKATFPYLNDPH